MAGFLYDTIDFKLYNIINKKKKRYENIIFDSIYSYVFFLKIKTLFVYNHVLMQFIILYSAVLM